MSLLRFHYWFCVPDFLTVWYGPHFLFYFSKKDALFVYPLSADHTKDIWFPLTHLQLEMLLYSSVYISLDSFITFPGQLNLFILLVYSFCSYISIL